MSNPKIPDNLEHIEIVLMKGLPYSGKSYALGEYLAQHGNVFDAVVSPDCIRIAMHGERFSARAEGLVWETAKIMARSLALWGHERIFIDATALKYEDRRTWAYHDPWRVSVWQIPTLPDLCIERALIAGDGLMIPHIERMYQYHQPLREHENTFIP